MHDDMEIVKDHTPKLRKWKRSEAGPRTYRTSFSCSWPNNPPKSEPQGNARERVHSISAAVFGRRCCDFAGWIRVEVNDWCGFRHDHLMNMRTFSSRSPWGFEASALGVASSAPSKSHRTAQNHWPYRCQDRRPYGSYHTVIGFLPPSIISFLTGGGMGPLLCDPSEVDRIDPAPR